MPAKTELYCDAPHCEEKGQYETVTVDGRAYEVILGPDHLKLLREIASWGRPAKGPRANVGGRAKRSTEERRLVALLDADKPGPDLGSEE